MPASRNIKVNERARSQRGRPRMAYARHREMQSLMNHFGMALSIDQIIFKSGPLTMSLRRTACATSGAPFEFDNAALKSSGSGEVSCKGRRTYISFQRMRMSMAHEAAASRYKHTARESIGLTREVCEE